MAGLFAKLEKKAAAAPEKATKKSTTWSVGTTEENKKVSEALSQLTRLNADAKALDAKMGIHKSVILKHAKDSFSRDYAATGFKPESPMIIQNAEGDQATFVLQDRSSSSAIKDSQRAELEALLGVDAVEKILVNEIDFRFSRSALGLPSVMKVVEKHLEAAMTELTKKELLPPDIELLEVDHAVRVRGGTLERLGEIVGKDSSKLAAVLDALGSSVTRYIKA